MALDDLWKRHAPGCIRIAIAAITKSDLSSDVVNHEFQDRNEAYGTIRRTLKALQKANTYRFPFIEGVNTTTDRKKVFEKLYDGMILKLQKDGVISLREKGSAFNASTTKSGSANDIANTTMQDTSQDTPQDTPVPSLTGNPSPALPDEADAGDGREVLRQQCKDMADKIDQLRTRRDLARDQSKNDQYLFGSSRSKQPSTRSTSTMEEEMLESRPGRKGPSSTRDKGTTNASSLAQQPTGSSRAMEEAAVEPRLDRKAKRALEDNAASSWVSTKKPRTVDQPESNSDDDDSESDYGKTMHVARAKQRRHPGYATIKAEASSSATPTTKPTPEFGWKINLTIGLRNPEHTKSTFDPLRQGCRVTFSGVIPRPKTHR